MALGRIQKFIKGVNFFIIVKCLTFKYIIFIICIHKLKLIFVLNDNNLNHYHNNNKHTTNFI